MKQHTRIIFAALCIVMVLSIVLSAAFIITSADHECTGDDCSICYHIHVCEQILKKLTLGTSVWLGMVAMGIASVLIPILSQNIQSANTLICMKVKLSC